MALVSWNSALRDAQERDRIRRIASHMADPNLARLARPLIAGSVGRGGNLLRQQKVQAYRGEPSADPAKCYAPCLAARQGAGDILNEVVH
jgi:hypothetical protein